MINLFKEKAAHVPTTNTSEGPEEPVEWKETSLPPKPKETPALRWYHFGALKGAAQQGPDIRNGAELYIRKTKKGLVCSYQSLLATSGYQ